MITCPPGLNYWNHPRYPTTTRLDPTLDLVLSIQMHISKTPTPQELLEFQTLDVGKRTHPRLPLAACLIFLYLVYLLIIYLLYPVRLSDLFGFEERGWGGHDIISSVRWMFTSRSLLSRIVMNW